MIRCKFVASAVISCVDQFIYELAASSLALAVPPVFHPSGELQGGRAKLDRIERVGALGHHPFIKRATPLRIQLLQTLIKLQRVQLLSAKRSDAVSGVGARLHLIIMHGQRVRQILLAADVGFACQADIVEHQQGAWPMVFSKGSAQFGADGMGATLNRGFLCPSIYNTN